MASMNNIWIPARTMPPPAPPAAENTTGSRAAAPPRHRTLRQPAPKVADTAPGEWQRTLNSGTGEFGEPVYDDASIARLAQRTGNNRTLTPAPAADGVVPSTNPATAPAAPRALSPAARTLAGYPTTAPAPISAIPVTRTLSLEQRSRAVPPVASTFGQSVRTMPDDNIVTVQQPQVSLRGADQMGEYYDSREDREARRKLASDLDSERFRQEMIAGNPGRRGRAALEALADNARQRAALAAGGEQLSAAAIQNRAERDNRTGIAGMQEAGQDRRTQIAADAAADREAAERAQQLDIAVMQDATTRAGQESRQETLTSADGRVWRIGSDGAARPVTDADGKQLSGAQPRDPNALTPAQTLESLTAELKAATDGYTAMTGAAGTATPGEVAAQASYIQNLRQQLAAVRGGGGASPAAPAGAGGQRQKPTWAEFQRRAQQQGSRMTPEQLRAYYDQMQ